MSQKIKYGKSTNYFKGENTIQISFNCFNRPLGLIRKIKDDSTDLEKPKDNQQKFRSNLNETTRGKREHKSEEQKSTINNLKFF